MLLLLLLTTALTTTSAQESVVVSGMDSESVEHFTVQTVHHDTVMTVDNVARKSKVAGDVTKHIKLNITLKNTKVVRGGRDGEPKPLQSDYKIRLTDEKDLVVSMKKLSFQGMTTQEITVRWPGNQITQTEEREVCFNMDKNVKWFNTYQQFSQQWPMANRSLDYIPFNSLQKDPKGELQHIVEGTFLASSGFILRLNPDSPLWYRTAPESSSQPAQMCITARAEGPYNAGRKEDDAYFDIDFTLFAGEDLRAAYIIMANHLQGGAGGIQRPPREPEEHMYAYPIWEITAGRSREFAEAADLTTANVKKFADHLKKEGQRHNVLLLDAWWALPTDYMVMNDDEKLHDFVHLNELLNPASGKGYDYRLHLAVTPYVPVGSPFAKMNPAFLLQDGLRSGSTFVIREGPQMNHSLVDFSNPKAARWFLDKLSYFQKTYKMASFVFEPVTVTDDNVKYADRLVRDVPALYSTTYAQIASQLQGGSMAIVKEARDNQGLPLFVNMAPRVSDWTDPRGIKSLIPTALALSLAGYSFIVPDLVGGRLPGPSRSLIPDPELYTRWAQATALMPAMQFATPPWYYNETISDAVEAAITLHTTTFKELMKRLVTERVKGDGSPIMRPMWWMDPEDPKLYEAGVVDTQFLFGEKDTGKQLHLVAPILEQGATDRMVYLPNGKWFQQQGAGNAPLARELQGGREYRVSADLNNLLFFKLQI